MSERYAKLARDWSLRGWDGEPLTVAHLATGEVRLLQAKGFYTAEACDGATDFHSLAFLAEHRALLDVLIEEGIVEACRRGDVVEPWQRYRRAPNPRLTAVHWCVTGRCNLRCRHCCMESPSGRYGDPSFERLAGLIGQFERANVFRVALSGGEPFLRADLLDLIALLAAKRIRVAEIYTNGLLVTGEHLAGIRESGFDPSFQISFDGVGGHDRMRGVEGVERAVIPAIEMVQEAGFHVVVGTCIDRTNAAGMMETYELMKSLGVQSWRIGPPQESGNWRGTTTALSLEEQARACEPLLDRWLGDGRPFSVQLSMFYRGSRHRREEAPRRAATRPMDSGASAASSTVPRFEADDYDCGAVREQCNLLPDGTLLPCPGYVDSSLQDRMPNLFREELSAVWTRSFLRDILDMKKKDVLAGSPECAACDQFGDCGAGCRASAVIATGDLRSRDPLICDLWKQGYRKRFELRAAGMPA